MPYMKEGLCVYKKNADGSRGEEVKCHETEEQAQAHFEALMANVPDAHAKEMDNSLDDQLAVVRRAFEDQFYPLHNTAVVNGESLWVNDVFPDHIVVSGQGKYFQVGYQKTKDAIVFDPRETWKEVTLTYAAVETTQQQPARLILREFSITDLSTQEPEIPTAPGIDLDALTKGDEEPYFITLAVGEIGRVSSNGLDYDEPLVKGLVEQINTKHPGGIMGHIKAEERSTAYPVPDVYWVGAKMIGKTAWAKGYLPPGRAKEHFWRQKAMGGKAATSIFGPFTSQMKNEEKKSWKAKGFELESLDLAPWERAALRLSGTFHVTSQMEAGIVPEFTSTSWDFLTGVPVTQDLAQEVTMPEKAAVLATLTADELQTVPAFAALRETIIAGVTQEHDTRVAALIQQMAEKDQRIAELEADNTAKATQVAEYQRSEHEAALRQHIAELTAWNTNGKPEATDKLNALRTMLFAMAQARLGGVVSELALAKPAVEELMTGDLKVLVEMTRDALSGPAIRVGGVGREGASKPVEPTLQEGKEALHTFGVS